MQYIPFFIFEKSPKVDRNRDVEIKRGARVLLNSINCLAKYVVKKKRIINRIGVLFYVPKYLFRESEY